MFKAFREVEIRVRALLGAPDSLVGTKLMEAALGEDGPLWSEEVDRGEQVARVQLFRGAIGLIKNPASHREIHFEDPTEAAEAVFLADLLMRILDHLEEEQRSKGNSVAMPRPSYRRHGRSSNESQNE